MGIPPVRRDRLLEAIEQFKEELPNNTEYQNWRDDDRYDYAMEHEGIPYVPCRIGECVVVDPSS